MRETIDFVRMYRYHQEGMHLNYYRTGNVLKTTYEIQDRKDGTVGLWHVVDKVLKHYFNITAQEFERLKKLNARDRKYIS
jgi:hypothetical protein